jgi:hypothetical protein
MVFGVSLSKRQERCSRGIAMLQNASLRPASFVWLDEGRESVLLELK